MTKHVEIISPHNTYTSSAVLLDWADLAEDSITESPTSNISARQLLLAIRKEAQRIRDAEKRGDEEMEKQWQEYIGTKHKGD